MNKIGHILIDVDTETIWEKKKKIICVDLTAKVLQREKELAGVNEIRHVEEAVEDSQH
jgi:hypothetical protein